MEERIVLPSHLNFRNSIQFVNLLHELPEADSYLIDFNEFRWIEPFGVLLVSNEIQRLARESKAKGKVVSAINFQGKNSYAAHIGFYQSCGLDFGNAPGEARGGPSYIPITIINTEEIRSEAIFQGKQIGDVIEDRAERLARTLAYEEYVNTFSYAIREIIRNVIEHSRSTNLAYCAQFWPQDYFAEIAILDTGIGINASLSHNRKLEITDDYGALCLSLLPGISGNEHRCETGGFWDNSGFGLYMISRLCENNGDFYIGSGSAGLFLGRGRKERISTFFPGTILKLGLAAIPPDNLRSLITKFIREGDLIAKKLEGGDRITSVSASKMLSSDFFLKK